jgi:transposase
MPRTRALPGPPVPRGPLPTPRRHPPSPPRDLPRRKGSELTPHLRTQITTLKEVAGWSYGEIHKKFPDLPLSTIKMTCLRSRIRHKEESLKRSGRPSKLNDDDRQKILQKIHEQPRVTYEDLCSEVDNKVKKRSIARLLCVEEMKKWRVMKRPYLTPEHAAVRLRWAERYQNFTKEDFDRVFWSDECTIERGIGLRLEYSFIRPSEQAAAGEVMPTPHRGFQVKQMFWAAFAGSLRRSGLIALYGDPESSRGGVNRFVIRDLYERVLPTLLIDPNSIFMQDNAPTHTAQIVREYVASLGREVMIWPPNSPDLNPIENLWTLLKQKIYKLRPDLLHMSNNETTLNILINTAKEAWQEIDLSILERLSESMPRRVQAIIDSEGWYTKY